MRAVAILLIVISLAAGYCRAQAGNEFADALYIHGNIYTVDPQQPHAEAIAVKQGRILFVGSDADAAKYQNRATRVIDLGGKTVVPGLTDSHCHLSGVGAREVSLNLEGAASLDNFLAKVKARVVQAKPDEWVTGRGWIETAWSPAAFPTRFDLDRIAPHNPVWLTRADGHGAVANSVAIGLAGISKDTADPFGGEVMRDRQTGEPTGMFLDNAQPLIAKHIPPRPSVEIARDLERGAKRNQALGWTSLHVPSSNVGELAAIEELYKEEKIKLRIDLALLGPSDDTKWLLKQGPIRDACSGRLSCRAIKVSFDGALGSTGAALLERYFDFDTSGFLKWKEEELLPMFEDALRRGVQVWTHAIGDRANREILRIYEKSFSAVPADQRAMKEPRWRVEHAQIVAPTDIPRFAALGVIPSMQPSHAIGDLHFAGNRLGLKRLEGAYAWQSFIKSGSIIAGGSDAPVERGEPMIEFYAAVARKDLQGYSGDGWHPEQAVSREQALQMFTSWPAFAVFHEDSRGTLKKGKVADFTVLTKDIMTIPQAEILTTRCAMTVIGGEVAYDAEKWQSIWQALAAINLLKETEIPAQIDKRQPRNGRYRLGRTL